MKKRLKSKRSSRGSSGKKVRKSYQIKKAAAGIATIKKPLLLASVEPLGHSMHRNSGLVLYWLIVLSLVVLNTLSVIVIPLLQLSSSSEKVLVVVAVLGLFFGYVTHRLVNLVDNLEPTHHFFARLLVPAAAILNLFVVSSAANKVAEALRIGFTHNPIHVSLAYGVAFVLPSLFALSRAAAISYFSSSSRGKSRAKK